MLDSPRYRQLQEEYGSLKDERARIDTLVEMALEVRNFDVDKAFEMATEIIERSNKAGYPRGLGRGYNLKGSCYWLHGDYDLGLVELQKAYEIATSIKERRLEARVLNNFGNIYRDLGDLANALNYFEKALAINEELGDELTQSVNLTSIANLLYDLNDYESALEYALRSMPIFMRYNDISRLLTINNTLGNIYFKQDQFDEALRYFKENLNDAEPDTAMQIMALSGIGKVYYKMHDYTNAYNYLQEALTKAQQLEYAEVQIICHFYIGRLMMDEGNYRSSLQHMSAAFELANEYMRKHDVMSLHEGLAMLYDKMGDVPKAFHHLKAYEQLKEEIFQQTTLNKLRNLQIRQQIELAQKEKEVAERTAYLKQQFMANMSHEIRTPMNAIVGMTRLLQSKDPRPDQVKYLNAIRQSADNLLVIINDILDLSKIEAGKIVIESTDFSLREVMQSLNDMLMLKAEEKNIGFNVSIDPQIPARLNGDPTRINQVLINLAGNAVKFTEHGQVSIHATLERREDSKNIIRFDVVDTGIGIAPDYVDKIFESFTQAGTDVARKFGGTGLGLTISKQLVTLMHGEISVKSELGKGTTFTVVLPLIDAAVQDEVKKDNILGDVAIKNLAGLKLLLVEDNEFNRMVAEDTLKEIIPNIYIDVAVNGRDAVEAVQKKNYDVVLMDIQMPVMDGVAATQAIRQTLPAPARDVKIIAMTANVLQEDVQLYLATGMNAYVSKPFQTEELLLKIANVLENKNDTMAPQEHKPVEPVLPPLPDQVTDMQFLRQFTGNNPEKINKYVNMFLENGPRLLKQITEALAVGDFPTIKIAAHSMKPQLSYMGVKEDISHIFMIEQSAGESAHQDRLPQLVTNLIRVCEKAFEELRNISVA
jgi:signal transduction histidine kinase/DNA-binding NarL/FixJ family response regulator